MRRSFGGGFKSNNNTSNFSRNDRRDDRNDNNRERNRFNSNNDHRKPLNRSFDSRNSSSDYKKQRRDFDDSRNSYQDNRRDHRDHQSGGGNRSSYGNNDRFDDRMRRSGGSNDFHQRRNSRDRTIRHSPNRSRDSFDTKSDRRAGNNRMSPPPPPSSSFYRSGRDRPSIKSRLNPPLRSSISSRLGRSTGGNRVLRRNDLRSGLIAKRSAPVNRARDYAKKIRQARMKLNEKSGSGNEDEDHSRSSSSKRGKSKEKSPVIKKESEVREHSRNDLEEDYLAIANDVNFDEDENESTTGGLKNKNSTDEKGKEKSTQENSETSDKKINDESTSKEAKSSRHHRSPSMDIDYICIHCDMHLSTANDYRNHLNRRTHLLAMRRVALKVRMTLNHLRKVQRDRQLEIEARIKDVEKITSKYCTVCKLNFRQSKDEHKESEDHKKIRNFLKPTCKICHIQLASPMKFEMHRCHLDHMRRKKKTNDETDDEVDLNELNLGDFKTVDSVGDVDDADEEKVNDEDAIETEKSHEISSPEKKDMGREYISKVEAFYCSICRDYLSHRSDEEKAITEHCKSRHHITRFNKYKKDDENKYKKTVKVKSPEKTKQNGNEDDEKEVKIEEKNGQEIKNEEGENSKEEKSKFKRYENNDE